MGDINCYYHKDRIAVEKCEDCGKYLCVECKQNVSRRHTRSSGKSTSTYYTHHLFCPDCNIKEVKRKYNPLGAILPCVVFIIFVIIVVAMNNNFNNDLNNNYYNNFPETKIPGFFIAALIFMGLLLVGNVVYQFVIKAPAEKEKAEKIQSKALEALKKSKIHKSKPKTPDKKTTGPIALYCKFCGAPLKEDVSTCPFCGMNWKWK